MAIELAPLCTIRIQLKPPIEVGPGPASRYTGSCPPVDRCADRDVLYRSAAVNSLPTGSVESAI